MARPEVKNDERPDCKGGGRLSVTPASATMERCVRSCVGSARRSTSVLKKGERSNSLSNQIVADPEESDLAVGRLTGSTWSSALIAALSSIERSGMAGMMMSPLNISSGKPVRNTKMGK